MLKLAICEDVAQEAERLQQMIERVLAGLSVNYTLCCFTSGEDLLLESDETGSPDILFLDIQMQGINGVETARRIRERDARALLIFVSSYDQYCKELIDTQPFGFIDKPIEESRVREILTHAVRLQIGAQEKFSFAAHKKQYSIPLSEIRYFQSDRRQVRIQLAGGNRSVSEYVFYGKLQEVQKTLDSMNAKFLRTGQSFLVNTQFIAEHTANEVICCEL